MATERRGCLSVLLGSPEARRSARAGASTAEITASSPTSTVPATDRRVSAPTFPYRPRSSLLSHAEIAFFRALQPVVAGRYEIFAKVRLLDLCSDLTRAQDQAAFNRIVGKHIDFVLCDPSTFQLVAGIELDDSTHRRADRVRRDAFVDEVFSVIRIPLLRFKVQLVYDAEELRRRIESLTTT